MLRGSIIILTVVIWQLRSWGLFFCRWGYVCASAGRLETLAVQDDLCSSSGSVLAWDPDILSVPPSLGRASGLSTQRNTGPPSEAPVPCKDRVVPGTVEDTGLPPRPPAARSCVGNSFILVGTQGVGLQIDFSYLPHLFSFSLLCRSVVYNQFLITWSPLFLQLLLLIFLFSWLLVQWLLSFF